MAVTNWKEKYKDKLFTAQEAAGLIHSGDHITTGLYLSLPYAFLEALSGRITSLEAVKLDLAANYKPLKLALPEYRENIEISSYFLTMAERKLINSYGAPISYMPLHLSDVRRVMSSRGNVLVAVGTPPDENGKISLGPCPADADLIRFCDKIIIEVNEQLPFVRGDEQLVDVDRVTALIDAPGKLLTVPPAEASPEEAAIAELIAERIPDGACIQLGIGGLGKAVGRRLKEKRELGIHTEMFVEPMVDLIECGAVTNSRKQLCRGKSIFGFTLGSERLYKLIDNNPLIESRPFAWVNDPRVIAQNDNVVSVNGAMQIDLSGQVCAESIGLSQFSGTGGQSDYVRGAKWSNGGMSFIALPSVRQDKETGALISKISLTLPLGSAVTTVRSDVQYIATEYGIVNLRGESLSSRAKLLISVAHPQFRDELTYQAKKAGIIV